VVEQLLRLVEILRFTLLLLTVAGQALNMAELGGLVALAGVVVVAQVRAAQGILLQLFHHKVTQVVMVVALQVVRLVVEVALLQLDLMDSL
jgi:hypothetical protein